MCLPGSEAKDICINRKEQVGDEETQNTLAKTLSKDERPQKSKEEKTDLT